MNMTSKKKARLRDRASFRTA